MVQGFLVGNAYFKGSIDESIAPVLSCVQTVIKTFERLCWKSNGNSSLFAFLHRLFTERATIVPQHYSFSGNLERSCGILGTRFCVYKLATVQVRRYDLTITYIYAQPLRQGTTAPFEEHVTVLTS